MAATTYLPAMTIKLAFWRMSDKCLYCAAMAPLNSQLKSGKALQARALSISMYIWSYLQHRG